MKLSHKILNLKNYAGCFPEYENNLKIILENCIELDEFRVLRLLKDNNNNLTEVLNILSVEGT